MSSFLMSKRIRCSADETASVHLTAWWPSNIVDRHSGQGTDAHARRTIQPGLSAADRLMGNQPVELQNRPHFIAVASRLIRQVLVDYARDRSAAKRDGGCRIGVEYLDALPIFGDAQLLSLNDALDDLSRTDERQAQIVEMKFFGGLSSPEISEVLGLSRATVDRDWATARVWLHRQMSRVSTT
jgi:RNA polymerase sigma factor (TIGR02999 family)